MTSDKGIALSRLLFWSVIFIIVAGISLPFFSSPVLATDSDGDGLSDAFETAFGSDPQSDDIDSDHTCGRNCCSCCSSKRCAESEAIR